MGYLPLSVTNYYSNQVVKAYKAPLSGTLLVARGEDLPPGTGTVTRDKVKNFTGKAKRGYRVRTVPRESEEREPNTVIVIEHTHGYEMHKQAVKAYARVGESVLNGEGARQSGRLVAESLNGTFFNGDSNSGSKGLFADAELDDYVVTEGKEWNTASPAPDSDIVEAIAELTSPRLYTGLPIKMAVSAFAYNQLIKRIPNTNTSYMDYIAKIPAFQNGINDIYPVNELADDEGLLLYYGAEVAERLVEQDIENYAVNDGKPDKDNMIYFNVDTYQALDIHHLDAMLPLKNLIDTEA